MTPFVYGAAGNFQTCDAWAFIGHGSSLSSAVYNGTLALYFALTIAFNFREHDINGTWIEYTFHLFPLLSGWGTAIVAVSLPGMFGPIGWTCWLGTYPPGCGTRFPCIRGDPDRLFMYRVVLFYLFLWISFLICLISMIVIFRVVRKQERRMTERYSFRPTTTLNQTAHDFGGPDPSPETVAGGGNGAESPLSSSVALDPIPPGSPSAGSSIDRPESITPRMNRSITSAVSTTNSNPPPHRPQHTPLSTRVAAQASLYVLFFFVTWIFPASQFIAAAVTGYLYFPLLCLTVLLLPLQGFFDAFIYLRPRYLQYRRIKQQQQQQQRLAQTRRSTRAAQAVTLTQAVAADDIVEGETMIDDAADDDCGQ